MPPHGKIGRCFGVWGSCIVGMRTHAHRHWLRWGYRHAYGNNLMTGQGQVDQSINQSGTRKPANWPIDQPGSCVGTIWQTCIVGMRTRAHRHWLWWGYRHDTHMGTTWWQVKGEVDQSTRKPTNWLSDRVIDRLTNWLVCGNNMATGQGEAHRPD